MPPFATLPRAGDDTWHLSSLSSGHHTVKGILCSNIVLSSLRMAGGAFRDGSCSSQDKDAPFGEEGEVFLTDVVIGSQLAS